MINISVIIPCYNSEDTIRRCLSSVFAQTYRNLEIICVNDGSTDKTGEIISELKDNSPFPFQIINQLNKGACAARNAGIAASTGDYLQFLDADDELLPEKIKHQLVLLEKTQPDFIVASYRKIFENGKSILVQPNNRDIWTALIEGKIGITSSNLFSKQAVLAAGGWNNSSRSSQETELMFQLLKKRNSFIFDDEPFTQIYRRQGSISATSKAENWERNILLRTNICDYLKSEKIFSGERKTALEKMIFDSIRILYVYNREKSVNSYHQFVKNKFKPKSSRATSSFYILLFSIFGFEITQKIYSLFK